MLTVLTQKPPFSTGSLRLLTSAAAQEEPQASHSEEAGQKIPVHLPSDCVACKRSSGRLALRSLSAVKDGRELGQSTSVRHLTRHCATLSAPSACQQQLGRDPANSVRKSSRGRAIFCRLRRRCRRCRRRSRRHHQGRGLYRLTDGELSFASGKTILQFRAIELLGRDYACPT